ncbi:hypothetical protein IMG5_152210 [Ichthyophthirius multifiliis]|uniref:EFHB C-terminal EF-hand domain-containing protein n=1 Tax=Ichthyophthirius multifiliis TaxID=5932 RepID=G0QYU4_ICHMU|nr:hypothetical protein IMG5_152210 [Ichthyophthirius multifiliis]EGR29619.1 hypothetical protein IMG5_152210 [Ichthyophthirius multifiliis]|eukprot:XP_004030855.1 hypothetical protein IMG5_152210 [Ichthyophthirius multifiliis]
MNNITAQIKSSYQGYHKQAGVSTKLPNESAANCIKPDNDKNPGTPEHVKKYRKSYKMQSGVTILHHGVKDDPKPNENFIYGKKVEGSDHVTDVFDGSKQQGIKQMINQLKEAQYASRTLEPLGEPMKRNYQFPDQVHDESFKFGLATKNSEYTAKEVMFPQKPIMNDSKTHQQYVFTHGNFEAGEQKSRDYNWPVDPKEHRFGKFEKTVTNQAQLAVHQDSIPNEFPKTIILKKKQEDFKNYHEDHLGQPKNLGQTNAKNDPNKVFGARLGGPDEWNAGKCIRGDGTLKEVQPDKDLGTTNKFGFRNLPKPGDENRIFGTPTIRDDIMKPQVKSIADPNNYGDEKPAVNLLFPQKYHYMGVDEQDFLLKRNKQEIKEIFKSIGFDYKAGKFEGIYRRALEFQNTNDEKVSIKNFMQAIQEMHHIE